MSVSYDGQGALQRRDHFTWILFRQFNNIIITIEKTLIFEIQLASHDTCQAEYRALVASYLRERQDAELQLGLMNIYSQESTAAATQPLTPRQRSIYHLREKIGSGTSGTVYRAVDVSTGAIYAAKAFRDDCMFEKEVQIHSRISHEHVVRFVDFSDEVRPLLVMEYLPLGNLGFQDRQQIDPVAVLQQGLKALAYLHPRGIKHRDIKPANILVQNLQPFLIKLADLGIATDKSVLHTSCGTKRYSAPEVWEHGEYTFSVDIWSLGVVVFECAYGLPERGRKTGPLSWCRKIIRAVEDWDSDSLVDLLSTKMLKMDPHDRMSASGCLEDALDLNLGMLNTPNFEVGDLAPTERMSTSLILEIVGINRKKIGDSDNDEEAETRILNPAVTSRQLSYNDQDLLQHADKRPRPLIRASDHEGSLDGQSKKRPRPEDPTVSNCGVDNTTFHEEQLCPPQALWPTGLEERSRATSSEPATINSVHIIESIWNGEWFRECRIQGNIIKLRVSDNWVSFESLAKAAGKTPAWILSTLQKVDRTSKEPYRHEEEHGTLIDFKLALPFITEFGLEKCRPLQSLRDSGTKLDQPVQITKTDIRTIEVRHTLASLGRCSIAICPSRKLINASHLLKAAQIRRSQLRRKLSICNITKFHHVAGYFVVQGTYVDYEDGLALCEHVGLDKEMILQGIGAHTEPHTIEEDRRMRDPISKSPLHITSGIANDSKPGKIDEVDQGRHSVFGVTRDEHSGSAEVYLQSSQSTLDISTRSSFWELFAANPTEILGAQEN